MPFKLHPENENVLGCSWCMRYDVRLLQSCRMLAYIFRKINESHLLNGFKLCQIANVSPQFFCKLVEKSALHQIMWISTNFLGVKLQHVPQEFNAQNLEFLAQNVTEGRDRFNALNNQENVYICGSSCYFQHNSLNLFGVLNA